MANSLLDFVMSLVRDPDAAGRYAADPAGMLAAAQLGDVTSADVDNLIPVVAESLSMSAPAHGFGGIGDALGAEPVSNVWASGAATAAFDAFDDRLPAPADAGLDATLPDRLVVDPSEPDAGVPAFVAADDADDMDTSLYYTEPLVDDGLMAEPASVGDWTGVEDLSGPDDQAAVFDDFD